jgi:hypothetical protein
MQTGLDFRDFFPRDSYLLRFYDTAEAHYGDLGSTTFSVASAVDLDGPAYAELLLLHQRIHNMSHTLLPVATWVSVFDAFLQQFPANGRPTVCAGRLAGTAGSCAWVGGVASRTAVFAQWLNTSSDVGGGEAFGTSIRFRDGVLEASRMEGEDGVGDRWRMGSACRLWFRDIWGWTAVTTGLDSSDRQLEAMDEERRVVRPFRDLFNEINDIAHPLRCVTSLAPMHPFTVVCAPCAHRPATFMSPRPPAAASLIVSMQRPTQALAI